MLTTRMRRRNAIATSTTGRFRSRSTRPGRIATTAAVAACVGLVLPACSSPVSYHPESLSDAPPAGGKVVGGTRGDDAALASGSEKEKDPNPTAGPTDPAVPTKPFRMRVPCAIVSLELPESWTFTKEGDTWAFALATDQGGGKFVVSGELRTGKKAIPDGDKLAKELQGGKASASVTTMGSGLIRALLQEQKSATWRLGQTVDGKTEIVTVAYTFAADTAPDKAIRALDQATQQATFTEVGTCES
ncbi:MAG TPA: hypothetical protein VI076_00010 [Actinopolymorphaceae bacterium]